MAGAKGGLSIPLDVSFILLNKLFFLSLALVFFAGVWLYYRIIRKSPPPPRAKSTIRLAAIGFLLLFFEIELQTIPHYGPLAKGLQSMVVLVCLANLLIFLIVDVFVYLRSRREAPTFLRDIVSLAVYLLVAIVSLRVVFHIEISSIITTTTVLTAAIAFAMQNALANAVSGFSIQGDKLLRQRSWIAIREKNVVGQIINVGFRYTTLRTLENNRVLVPNSLIMQNIVTSFGSRDDREKGATNLHVSLGYDLPPEQAKALMLRVLDGEPGVLREPAPLVRLVSFSESSIDYQLKFYLEEYSERDSLNDKLLSRIWYAVTREGYQFPFPHRQIISHEIKKPFIYPVTDITAALHSMELFGMLSDAERQGLAEKARRQVFGPGEVLVRQHEEGDSLFIVIRGRLHVLVDGVQVGSLGEGELFGEMSLLTGEPRKATVVADSEVWLAEIARQVMEPFLRENEEVMHALSAILAERELRNQQYLHDADRAEAHVRKKEEYLRRLRRFFGLDRQQA